MSQPTVVVVSGYFNPIHRGHVRLLRAARELGDRVVVIVNNDRQQMLKKGRIIMDEGERCEVVAAMRDADEVVLADDEDGTVVATLAAIAERYDSARLVFANGGDRSSTAEVPETAVCERYGIEMLFDVGGADKAQSSSDIIAAIEAD